MIKLRCVVERITYLNPDNGYTVLKVKVSGYKDPVTLIGYLLDLPAGTVLLCEGEWKSRPEIRQRVCSGHLDGNHALYALRHRTLPEQRSGEKVSAPSMPNSSSNSSVSRHWKSLRTTSKNCWKCRVSAKSAFPRFRKVGRSRKTSRMWWYFCRAME